MHSKINATVHLMLIWVVDFSREGYKIDIVVSRQKLGIILENKAFKIDTFKWKKKIRNILLNQHWVLIFDIENRLRKSDFGNFWQLDTVNSQYTIIFFGDIDFWLKNFLILYPSLKNSTTHITIVHLVDTSVLMFALQQLLLRCSSPKTCKKSSKKVLKS